MLRTIALAIIAVFLASTAHAKTRAKLIHYGWDNPTIANLPQALTKLAYSPFDGISVAAPGIDEIFKTTVNSDESSSAALAKLVPGQLAQSYLVIHAAAEDSFDWTNDSHWASAKQNMRILAKLAHQGGFKGVVFDMEPYGKSPWDYATQPARTKLSFSAFQARVEQRGVDMMNAMQDEFPGLDVWCLYGLSAFNGSDQPLQENGYGLWASFFGGWLKTAAPTTRIIDGNEPSYYYTSPQDFSAGNANILEAAERLPEDSRAAYLQKIKVGHAVYVDGIMNLTNSPRFIGHYFKSDSERSALLKQNISSALEASDTLVWVYAENVKWWESPPRQDIDTAIREAKLAVLTKADPAIERAAKKWRERISIGGKMTDSNGKGLKPDGFEPELAAAACSTWGDRGEYACEFPKGSSGQFKPIFKGRKVTPSQLKFKNLSASNWGVNWRVAP
jgi:hypothetical protein